MAAIFKVGPGVSVFFHDHKLWKPLFSMIHRWYLVFIIFRIANKSYLCNNMLHIFVTFPRYSVCFQWSSIRGLALFRFSSRPEARTRGRAAIPNNKETPWLMRYCFIVVGRFHNMPFPFNNHFVSCVIYAHKCCANWRFYAISGSKQNQLWAKYRSMDALDLRLNLEWHS